MFSYRKVAKSNLPRYFPFTFLKSFSDEAVRLSCLLCLVSYQPRLLVQSKSTIKYVKDIIPVIITHTNRHDCLYTVSVKELSNTGFWSKSATVIFPTRTHIEDNPIVKISPFHKTGTVYYCMNFCHPNVVGEAMGEYTVESGTWFDFHLIISA